MFFEILWLLLLVGVIILFGFAAWQEVRSKNYLNAAGIVFLGIILICILRACG